MCITLNYVYMFWCSSDKYILTKGLEFESEIDGLTLEPTSTLEIRG